MTIRYCLRCASPLKKINYTHYVCANGHDFWNNPKATVCIVIEKNGMFLAAERAESPHKGKFQLPGGFVDHGENAESAIVREVTEETGLTLHTIELLTSVAHDFTENVGLCDIVFFSNDWSGTPTPSDDVASLQWKPLTFINSAEWAWDFRNVPEAVNKRLQT